VAHFSKIVLIENFWQHLKKGGHSLKIFFVLELRGVGAGVRAGERTGLAGKGNPDKPNFFTL